VLVVLGHEPVDGVATAGLGQDPEGLRGEEFVDEAVDLDAVRAKVLEGALW